MRALLALACATAGVPAYADCERPDNEVTIQCENCGNLEQNLPRGFDIAWNAFRSIDGLREEIGLTGSTEVILALPPTSSAGVLWYRANINDPSWRISNSLQYSRMVSLMESKSRGFEGSVGVGSGRTGAGASARWEQRITQQIGQARLAAISVGSGPITVIIEDQNGNEIGRKTYERNTGGQGLPVPDQRELEPKQQYEEIDCFDDDVRVPPKPQRRRGGDRGLGPMLTDRSLAASCSFTNDVRCRGVVNSPYSSGVVCSVDVTARC